jgi:autoinducer 2-binding periplasmic protein LuxP
MKRILLLILPTLLLQLVVATAAFSSEYLTVQEYYSIHPEQVKIAKKFNSIVQQKGVPLAKGVQKKPIRIVFIYPGYQVSDYWRRSIKSFTRRMDEIGIQYEISEHFTKVTELRIQEQQLQAALAQDPDYLIYTLNVMKHRKLIERTLTKGRPKLILQNITTPLRDWEGKQPFLYVGFDHATGTTEFLAKYLLNRTGGKGDYAMLYHSQGYVSTMRGDTLIRYLDDHSSHNLVASYYTDGQRNKSKDAVLEIIKEHDVKFIYACATDTAFGALDALRETNKLGQIIVNGWGGGSIELKAIQKAELDYTVMRMNDDNGVAMAEAVRLDIEKRPNMVPTIFSGEFVLVGKGVKQDELTKLKARAFRYSGVD